MVLFLKPFELIFRGFTDEVLDVKESLILSLFFAQQVFEDSSHGLSFVFATTGELGVCC
jgi:hypothetical protein